MGWFHGSNCLIINDEGEILSFCLTSGNVDDRDENVMHSPDEIFRETFLQTEDIISQKLFENLLKERLYTCYQSPRKNMKNKLMVCMTE